MKDQPLADVQRLLDRNVMEFRDMPKGRDPMEHQKADARHLELEIKDLTAYMRSQVALVTPTSLQELRQYGEQR